MVKRLSATEISTALTLFAELQTQLLEDLSTSPKETEEVKALIADCAIMNPVAFVKQSNLMAYNERIFSNPGLRDFVLDLTFRFFALSGESDTFIESLCKNLSDGICVDGPNPTLTTLPEAVASVGPMSLYPWSKYPGWIAKWMRRFGSKEAYTLEEVLLNNKHLVSLLLIHLTNTAL